jgi:predicted amidophosphoribosyltransferase
MSSINKRSKSDVDRYFCRYCGRENKPDGLYCEKCGKKAK